MAHRRRRQHRIQHTAAISLIRRTRWLRSPSLRHSCPHCCIPSPLPPPPPPRLLSILTTPPPPSPPPVPRRRLCPHFQTHFSSATPTSSLPSLKSSPPPSSCSPCPLTPLLHRLSTPSHPPPIPSPFPPPPPPTLSPPSPSLLASQSASSLTLNPSHPPLPALTLPPPPHLPLPFKTTHLPSLSPMVVMRRTRQALWLQTLSLKLGLTRPSLSH